MKEILKLFGLYPPPLFFVLFLSFYAAVGLTNSSVNGVFVDGFNAVGINTLPALHATLNHDKNLNLNIVDLANMAGFETFGI